jgi:hypothetical protein
MPLIIIKSTISLPKLSELASEIFGDMVKAVVDVESEAMAVGPELHVDAEQLLLQQGSQQQNLWGINLYPEAFGDEKHFVEFDSMINLRPGQGNRSRGVEDPEIRKRVLEVVRKKITA